MDRESVNSGRQLKFAREYRGYNQSQLCKKVKGLSQSNLSKFEHGFKGRIADEKIEEIMKFLDFPVEFLNVRIYIHYD